MHIPIHIFFIHPMFPNLLCLKVHGIQYIIHSHKHMYIFTHIFPWVTSESFLFSHSIILLTNICLFLPMCKVRGWDYGYNCILDGQRSFTKETWVKAYMKMKARAIHIPGGNSVSYREDKRGKNPPKSLPGRPVYWPMMIWGRNIIITMHICMHWL